MAGWGVRNSPVSLPLLVPFDQKGELGVHPVFDDPVALDHSREVLDPDALDLANGLGILPHLL
jgi:hypothetical protein